MTKAVYVGVAGKARKVKKGYIGVGGKARKIKKAYVGVGGVARPFWGGGELAYYGEVTPLSQARSRAGATSVGNYAIFAGGGTSLTSGLPNVDAYNGSLVRSTPASLSDYANYPAATTVGNYAIFAGGFVHKTAGNVTPYKTVTAYNASLTKSTATSMDATTGYQAAATVGNYALIGGGVKYAWSWSIVSTMYSYNSSLTKGTPAALTTARADAAAASVGNYAVFAGGTVSKDAYGRPWVSSTFDMTTAVEAYDSSLTKTAVTSLDSYATGMAATSVGNYVLFGGGDRLQSSETIDAYDSSLTKVYPKSDLSRNQYKATATTIGGFAIFAVGNKVVEAYDESLTKSIPAELPYNCYYGASASVGNYALFAIGDSSGGAGSLNRNYVCAYTAG